MSEQMLYDDNAMNNALSLISAADSKLAIASIDYSSGALNGKKYISDAETIIEEVEIAFTKAKSALDSINTSISSQYGNSFNTDNR